MSADPEMWYNAEARPFYADTERHDQPQPVAITREEDHQIQTLIAENEPFQKLNDLVEMIGETFRRPKETEQAKWWSLGDISQLLANRYPNFDPETPFQKIGNALNDVQFNFKSKRKTNHMEYWLIEK
jgi:hypothetical protein